MFTSSKMALNIKEFSDMEHYFAPGHGSCSGCGFPMIVRTVLKAAGKNTVACLATGCLEVTTTQWPRSSWKIPCVHSLFENSGATIAGVESAYRALKKQGKIKKDINFVVFAGDGGTYDIGLQSLSGMLERGHKAVFVLYDNGAYMNCLSLDSFIMTKDGLKRITDIQLGEKIYAFEQATGEITLKNCTGIFDNGIKKVYELSTLHHSIKTTSNHPFLVLKRKGRNPELIWKTLAEIKKGEEIIVMKGNPLKSASYAFKQIKISKKGDYKINRINNIKLPEKSSPEFMEMLGLYVGDGWNRIEKGEIGFALPKGTDGSKRLISDYRKIFKKDIVQKEQNYIYIYSVNLARFIDSLGFGNSAKTKLIPHWIFNIPQEEKEAFLNGLMLSDGYSAGNSKRYVSASMDLLKSLRLLLQTMKYRVGKIHTQIKKKGSLCVYRPLLEDSIYGYICFSKKNIPDIKKYLSQTKQRDFLADKKHFSTEKVISVKYIKEEPTLDLRVEGEHNFIADGIVVHNTGNQRSSGTPYGANTSTTPVGNVLKGNMLFRKDIMKVVAAHNIPYIAQAAAHNWSDLFEKAKKAFAANGPAFLNVLSPCQLNWGTKTDMAIDVSKLAVNTNFWPLYEIENGVWKLNFKPSNPLPVSEFLKHQKRFKHLLLPENKMHLDKLQESIDKEWNFLQKQCKMDE